MSKSNYLEDACLNAVFNNVALQKSTRFVKLHTGDPGEDGTANAAGETTRKALSDAASSGGVVTSVNDLIWASVSTSETYSHVSVWDHVSAGNCLYTGALTAPQAVVAGNTFTIATGSLTITET